MDHGAAGGLVHELVHWVAAVVLVIGGAAAILLSARASRRERLIAVAAPIPVTTRPGATGSVELSLGVILATLSLGAAAIHLAAAPSHYVELGDIGAGFLVAAALQAWWAHAILGEPARRTLLAGAAINVGILVAWLVSRTAGLPVGPTPGVAEPLGLPDGASTAFEALIVALVAIRASDLDRWLTSRCAIVRPLLAVGVVPVVGLVVLTTSLASLAIVAGADHGMPHADGGHAAMVEGAPPR
jgi:hypothetical protein